MKKVFIILLGIALILPLYSQEYEDDDDDYDYEYEDESDYEAAAGEEIAPIEIAPKEAAPKETAPKRAPPPVYGKKTKEEPVPQPEEEKKTYFARKYFEIGFDAGIGFDNGLIGLNDFFKKTIVLDLNKIAQSIPKEGSGLNFDLSMDFFMNIMNIHIGKGLWDFGFIVDVDGGVNMNIPKSLFTLISEGNINQHDSAGKISASGSIFTGIGLKGLAKYRVGGRPLSIGFKPAVYTPAVYIPSSTGITYNLSTVREKDGTIEEGLFLTTKGGISVYTPTSLEKMEPGRFIIGPSTGFDLSLGVEYAFSPFLDIGGNITNIPIAAAALTNEMKLRLEDKNTGDDFGFDLSGDLVTPDLDFTPVYIYNVRKEVHRPLQFDLYAHYRPFKSELLVVRPNIGFTVNINKGDEKWYFNGGLEARVNLIDFFVIYVGSGYKEEIWRQRAGLAINLRAFELGLEAMLRDQTFEGCFKERGLGFNLGLRFGW